MTDRDDHGDDGGADAAAANSAQPASFETGLARLAELVNRLEGGGLGLSDSIAAYERGVAILRELHDELARAEERIRLLTAVDDAGRAITEPFGAVDEPADGAAGKVGRKPASRSQTARRTPRPSTLPGMDESQPDT